jgi:hypothetical protein
MEYPLAAVEGFDKHLFVTDIANEDGHALGQHLGFGRVSCMCMDLVTVSQQLLHQIGSEKTGCAGYRRFCHGRVFNNGFCIGPSL